MTGTPRALAALAEGFLRDWLLVGAGLFSLLVGVIGGISGELWWATVSVPAGVAGLALVLIAVARRWSTGRQWAVIIGVLALQAVIMGLQR